MTTERSILGYKLIMSCSSCPEQYEVYDSNGDQVAYLRLRFGRFTGESPDAGDHIFYSHTFENDPYKGDFGDEAETLHYLGEAIDALVEYLVSRSK